METTIGILAALLCIWIYMVASVSSGNKYKWEVKLQTIGVCSVFMASISTVTLAIMAITLLVRSLL